jgi:hypothetical protein
MIYGSSISAQMLLSNYSVKVKKKNVYTLQLNKIQQKSCRCYQLNKGCRNILIYLYLS